MHTSLFYEFFCTFLLYFNHRNWCILFINMNTDASKILLEKSKDLSQFYADSRSSEVIVLSCEVSFGLLFDSRQG